MNSERDRNEETNNEHVYSNTDGELLYISHAHENCMSEKKKSIWIILHRKVLRLVPFVFGDLDDNDSICIWIERDVCGMWESQLLPRIVHTICNRISIASALCVDKQYWAQREPCVWLFSHFYASSPWPVNLFMLWVNTEFYSIVICDHLAFVLFCV